MVMIMADIEYTIGHKNRNRRVNRHRARGWLVIAGDKPAASRMTNPLESCSWTTNVNGTELAAKIKSLGAQGKNLAKNYKFRWNVNVIAALISIGCIGIGIGIGIVIAIAIGRVPASPDGAGI